MLLHVYLSIVRKVKISLVTILFWSRISKEVELRPHFPHLFLVRMLCFLTIRWQHSHNYRHLEMVRSKVFSYYQLIPLSFWVTLSWILSHLYYYLGRDMSCLLDPSFLFIFQWPRTLRIETFVSINISMRWYIIASRSPILRVIILMVGLVLRGF